MLSRIAEQLYWIGRFVERSEDISRLVTAHLYSSIQVDLVEDDSAAQHLLGALGAPLGTVREVAAWWVAGRENPSSVVACVRSLRESARRAREVLSLEAWEAINDASASLERLLSDGATIEQIAAAVPRWTQPFFGVIETSAPRDSSWAYMRLGVMLERAAMTLRALSIGAESRSDWAHDDPLTLHAWTVTLRACAALDAFRKTTIAMPTGRAVVELLLRSTTCPRSVVFALREAESLLPFGADATCLVGDMRAELENRPIEELFADLSGSLHRLLDESDSVHEAIVRVWRASEAAG